LDLCDVVDSKVQILKILQDITKRDALTFLSSLCRCSWV
jgi:hypothetical protein